MNSSSTMPPVMSVTDTALRRLLTSESTSAQRLSGSTYTFSLAQVETATM